MVQPERRPQRQTNLGEAIAAIRSGGGFSRRTLLSAAGEAAKLVGVAVTVGGGAAACDAAPNRNEYYDNREKLSKYAKASAVLVDETDGFAETNNDSFRGHGGIFEYNGRYFFVTLDHVIDDIPEDKYITATFFGENGRTYRRDIPKDSKFVEFSERRNSDQVIAYELLGDDALMQAIKSGEITPLKVQSKNILQEDEALGLVNSKGQVDRVFFYTPMGGPSASYCHYNFDDGGQSCAGQSGTAVLVLDKYGNPTGESVGLHARSAGHMPPGFDACGDLYGKAMIFNKLFPSNQ